MQSPKPLSPHLQIYTLPLTVVLSILHRAAGAFLSVGAVFFTAWLVLLAGDKEVYHFVAGKFAYHWVGKTLLYAWIAALYFHLANGVRHLIWDMGFGFQLKNVDRSSILVIVFTVVMTISSWVVVEIVQGRL